MDNITITPRGGDLTCMSAAFTLEGARYHVWFDPRTMQLTAPILYKNPPDGTKYRSEGHFDTRKLNATTSKNVALVAKLLATVVQRKLVEAAIEKIQTEDATEARERYVLDIVRAYWAAAMRGDTLPEPPKAISDEEFKTASASLADRIAG